MTDCAMKMHWQMTCLYFTDGIENIDHLDEHTHGRDERTHGRDERTHGREEFTRWREYYSRMI